MAEFRKADKPNRTLCNRCHREMDDEKAAFLDIRIYTLNFDKHEPPCVYLCHDCYDKFKDFMEELGHCKLFEED